MNEKNNPNKRTSSWQKELLPLMTRMLIGLTIFFFLASFIQVFYLHKKIEDSPTMDLKDVYKKITLNERDFALKEGLSITQWQTLAELDKHALNQRYHQANVLLMARIWTRYLCFVTGMILCLVGASFVLGKIDQAESTLDGQNELGSFSIKTSSPGLVLAVLGTALMMTSVLTHNNINVTDASSFLRLNFIPSIISKKPEQLQMGEELITDTHPQKTEKKTLENNKKEYKKLFKGLDKKINEQLEQQ